MPYTQDLHGGEVIRDPRTRAIVHVEHLRFEADPVALVATLTGHHVRTGHPITITHSASLYVVEIPLSGATVEYHGSLIEQRHHLYRLAGPCECEPCQQESAEGRPRYQLTSELRSEQLDHVARTSFAIICTACTTCPPAAGTQPITPAV